MSVPPPTTEVPELPPEEQMHKLTVLLPADTVQKIEYMARVAKLGSKGRTIQALVDLVWDSQTQTRAYERAIERAAEADTPVRSVAAQMVFFNSISPLMLKLMDFHPPTE